MSLYVYSCEVCGAKTERLRPASDKDAPTVCSVCGAKATRVYENGHLSIQLTNGQTITN